jgi:hypothetical protein
VVGLGRALLFDRHCERSEAIQKYCSRPLLLDCFGAKLLAMTAQRTWNGSMTVYTVHLQGEDAQAASFVPEGFAWGGFVFAPLWLLWHQLWLAFVLWCAAMALIFATPLGLSIVAKELCAFLIAFLVGHEGHQWLRQKLTRAGKPLAAVVSADNRDEAEVQFFHRSREGQPFMQGAPLRPAPLTQPPAAATPLGLFPEPENRL